MNFLNYTIFKNKFSQVRRHVHVIPTLRSGEEKGHVIL